MVPRVLAALFLLATSLPAEVVPGSSRDQVLAEFGPPRGSTKAGAKEILSYPFARVLLEGGRVTEIALLGPLPKAAPSAAPAAAAPMPSSAVAAAPPVEPAAPTPSSPRADDPWILNFETAKATATKDRKRILVLFTGTDWCGPCQEFQAQVAYHPDFLRTFSPSFVFLKINWLRNTPQPPAEAEQAARLRQQYGIAVYPTLLVLSADGTELTRVDTRKGRAASGTTDYFIQAIDEARVATRDGRPAKSGWWPF